MIVNRRSSSYERADFFARRANQRGFVSLPCPAPFAKIFLFFRTQITPITRAVLPHTGAYRDRHGRGVGCGGRGSVGRNGISGQAQACERSPSAQTRDVAAYGEVVWSCSPVLFSLATERVKRIKTKQLGAVRRQRKR